ncbi:MAG TPA: adenylyltransferase/cytidyltransferase family protein [Longimicrobiales bacterium]|nr:adenylyltransferase/cytidyltransferase family protein [Longimicrobiales bacterium]
MTGPRAGATPGPGTGHGAGASAGPGTPRRPDDKLLERAELVRRYGPQAGGRAGTVVFTNGCFELLHAGHVAYLARAREMGDALVVGVNGDASARRLAKGPGRPHVPARDRALVVAALESVDAVCLFDEDTPAALVEDLLPAVLVKGADWELDEIAGREVVEAAGGRVVRIPLLEGRSTSELLRRIREETHA